MEDMEPVVTQESKVEVKPEPSRWYEGHISLEDAKTFIKSNIATAARSFIAIGFYLKCVRDRELYVEEDYQDVWEFAKAEYGISKSTASRYMTMNDRFSENGNSPNIREEYRAFGKSQLQEMLSLEEDQLEQVKPGDRVEDIRNLRKPKEVPYIELPGQMEIEIDFPDALPADQQPLPMISQKQTFEMNVEDMLPGEEPDSIAISQQEPEEKWEFSTTPTGCPYRAAYSCTIPAEKRAVPGDGNSCGSSCCWSCKFHGACKMECNASAGRDGAPPEYDAAWFVREWAKCSPGDLKRVLEACRRSSTNAERAKAMQEEISPYGAYCHCCREYDFSFHGFAGGMDFQIGKVDIHLKYGRFLQELMNLYPDFEESESKEPETVIEEPGNVPEQSESVPEPFEPVIDGEFVEVPPEPETTEYTPRYFLEEQKEKLDKYLRIMERTEMNPADVKFLECQKTIVAALACMVAELERPEPEPEPVKQEQPELPILKNNDQRAAFVDAYETWPLWIETKETEERYYRYDLPAGSSMVVKVYHTRIFDYKAPGSYEDKFRDGWGDEEYYLLREGKFFRNCRTSRPDLIEKLKELQKKGKDKNPVENHY